MMKRHNEIIDYKKQNTKHGAVLPMVALGILAVAGLVPFLFENTESNQKVTESVDTTNKITWALESAIEEKYKEINKDGLKGLASVTTNIEEQASVTFKYTNQIDASAGLAKYNSYLDKNSCLEAKGERNGNYDLSSLKLNMAKPGVAVVNTDYYVWDKYGILYKLNDNTKVAVKGIGGKVWQVFSENSSPLVLTTDMKAYRLTVDSNGQAVATPTELGNEQYIQISGNAGNLVVAVPMGTNHMVSSFDGDKNVSVTSEPIKDISAGANHGLAINTTHELWAWGSNSYGQVKNKKSGDYFYEPVKLSSDTRVLFNGESTGSIVPLIDNSDPVRRYLTDYYTHGNIVNGDVVEILDETTGEVATHTVSTGKKEVVCDCALCRDIINIRNGSGQLKTEKGGMPFIAVEDMPIESLQFMFDLDQLSNNDKVTPENLSKIKVSIKRSEDDTEVVSFSGGKFVDTNYFPALGNVGLYAFSNNKDYTEAFAENSNELKNYETPGGKSDGTNYFTLPQGNYYVELTYPNKENGSGKVSPWALYYGWKNDYTGERDYKHANGIDSLYGAIFRMNDKIYNLCGKSQTRNEEVLFHAIAAGENFSLALVTSKEDIETCTIAGWGNNEYGQLGSGIGTDTQVMKEITIGSETPNLTYDDTIRYHDMKAGRHHALFLTTGGEVFVWGGSNEKATEADYLPHKVSFENGGKIVSIAAGNDRSMALDENGKIYTWEVNQGTKSSPVIGLTLDGGNGFSVEAD